MMKHEEYTKLRSSQRYKANYTKLYNHCVQKAASAWTRIGATVNYSFFENFTPSNEQVYDGLKDLGVDINTISREKKWWQFWKDDTNDRFVRAIMLIDDVKLKK